MDKSRDRWFPVGWIAAIAAALVRKLGEKYDFSGLKSALDSFGITSTLNVIGSILLALLALCLLVYGIRRLWLVVQGREWLLRLKDRSACMRRLEYVFRSLSWAAIMAGASYVLHPRLGNGIQYRLGLGMPWLLDVLWFALPFGVAMSYLTYRFRAAPAERFRGQEKRDGRRERHKKHA